MSSTSLADSLTSAVKDAAVDKPKDSLAKIVSPPHFGDLGKAANDLFSKVARIPIPPINWPPSPPPIGSNTPSRSAFGVVGDEVLTVCV
jgi:hypothetical protein